MTLTELLIAMGIMAVVATYAIPKVLMAQQDGRLNAIAKETASMISGAYQMHRLQQGITSATTSADLTHYMNYVKVETDDTNCTHDYYAGLPNTFGCTTHVTGPHLRLHNNALLITPGTASFNGTSRNHHVYFLLDADGRATGQGDTIMFILYANGRLSTLGSCDPDTTSLPGCPYATGDPPWLKW